MIISTEGLVIREQNVGEADRLVSILTKDCGVIRAFATGARRIKSRYVATTTLLSYSHFTLYRGRDSYRVNETSGICVFANIRSDLERLAVSQYFCELAACLVPEEYGNPSFLQTVISGLYHLNNLDRSIRLVKAATELRMLSLAGYMPNLVSCCRCGEGSGGFFLDCAGGQLICAKCGDEHGLPQGSVPLSAGVLTAMRHIIYSKPERLFGFKLSESGTAALDSVCEKYCLAQTNRRFKTLEFLHSLSEMFGNYK